MPEDVIQSSHRVPVLAVNCSAALLQGSCIRWPGADRYVEPIATADENALTGLTEVEAARRLEARGALRRQRSSRSYRSIVRGNTVNIPNGILLLFGGLTLAFGSWKDALFLGILVANIGIGSFQEIRSKRALDRLAALVAPEAVVVRDGVDRRVPVDRVVVGDLLRVAAGDQVVADGRLVTADGLALDEANLTGESEPAVRDPGEPVWSGSFAVEGAALFEATAVGADSRAAPSTAKEPDHTGSPGPRTTGSDSPVRLASSRARPSAVLTVPSATTWSPAARRTRSPTTTSSTGRRRSTPSRTTSASGATSAASRSSARLERISWNEPIATFDTRIPRKSASRHDAKAIVSTPKNRRIPFGMLSVFARMMLA
jgi:hypothetical protein